MSSFENDDDDLPNVLGCNPPVESDKGTSTEDLKKELGLTKKPFLKSRKGKFILGIALLLACFWTAYSLDYVLNGEPTVNETFKLSVNCWTDIQTRTIDGSLVYMGFECYNTVHNINEVELALDELVILAKERGFDGVNFQAGMASAYYKDFTQYGDSPGDGA